MAATQASHRSWVVLWQLLRDNQLQDARAWLDDSLLSTGLLANLLDDPYFVPAKNKEKSAAQLVKADYENDKEKGKAPAAKKDAVCSAISQWVDAYATSLNCPPSTCYALLRHACSAEFTGTSLFRENFVEENDEKLRQEVARHYDAQRRALLLIACWLTGRSTPEPVDVTNFKGERLKKLLSGGAGVPSFVETIFRLLKSYDNGSTPGAGAGANNVTSLLEQMSLVHILLNMLVFGHIHCTPTLLITLISVLKLGEGDSAQPVEVLPPDVQTGLNVLHQYQMLAGMAAVLNALGMGKLMEDHDGQPAIGHLHDMRRPLEDAARRNLKDVGEVLEAHNPLHEDESAQSNSATMLYTVYFLAACTVDPQKPACDCKPGFPCDRCTPAQVFLVLRLKDTLDTLTAATEGVSTTDAHVMSYGSVVFSVLQLILFSCTEAFKTKLRPLGFNPTFTGITRDENGQMTLVSCCREVFRVVDALLPSFIAGTDMEAFWDYWGEILYGMVVDDNRNVHSYSGLAELLKLAATYDIFDSYREALGLQSWGFIGDRLNRATRSQPQPGSPCIELEEAVSWLQLLGEWTNQRAGVNDAQGGINARDEVENTFLSQDEALLGSVLNLLQQATKTAVMQQSNTKQWLNAAASCLDCLTSAVISTRMLYRIWNGLLTIGVLPSSNAAYSGCNLHDLLLKVEKPSGNYTVTISFIHLAGMLIRGICDDMTVPVDKNADAHALRQFHEKVTPALQEMVAYLLWEVFGSLDSWTYNVRLQKYQMAVSILQIAREMITRTPSPQTGRNTITQILHAQVLGALLSDSRTSMVGTALLIGISRGPAELDRVKISGDRQVAGGVESRIEATLRLMNVLLEWCLSREGGKQSAILVQSVLGMADQFGGEQVPLVRHVAQYIYYKWEQDNGTLPTLGLQFLTLLCRLLGHQTTGRTVPLLIFFENDVTLGQYFLDALENKETSHELRHAVLRFFGVVVEMQPGMAGMLLQSNSEDTASNKEKRFWTAILKILDDMESASLVQAASYILYSGFNSRALKTIPITQTWTCLAELINKGLIDKLGFQYDFDIDLGRGYFDSERGMSDNHENTVIAVESRVRNVCLVLHTVCNVLQIVGRYLYTIIATILFKARIDKSLDVEKTVMDELGPELQTLLRVLAQHVGKWAGYPGRVQLVDLPVMQCPEHVLTADHINIKEFVTDNKDQSPLFKTYGFDYYYNASALLEKYGNAFWVHETHHSHRNRGLCGMPNAMGNLIQNLRQASMALSVWDCQVMLARSCRLFTEVCTIRVGPNQKEIDLFEIVEDDQAAPTSKKAGIVGENVIEALFDENGWFSMLETQRVSQGLGLPTQQSGVEGEIISRLSEYEEGYMGIMMDELARFYVWLVGVYCRQNKSAPAYWLSSPIPLNERLWQPLVTASLLQVLHEQKSLTQPAPTPDMKRHAQPSDPKNVRAYVDYLFYEQQSEDSMSEGSKWEGWGKHVKDSRVLERFELACVALHSALASLLPRLAQNDADQNMSDFNPAGQSDEGNNAEDVKQALVALHLLSVTLSSAPQLLGRAMQLSDAECQRELRRSLKPYMVHLMAATTHRPLFLSAWPVYGNILSQVHQLVCLCTAQAKLPNLADAGAGLLLAVAQTSVENRDADNVLGSIVSVGQIINSLSSLVTLENSVAQPTNGTVHSHYHPPISPYTQDRQRNRWHQVWCRILRLLSSLVLAQPQFAQETITFLLATYPRTVRIFQQAEERRVGTVTLGELEEGAAVIGLLAAMARAGVFTQCPHTQAETRYADCLGEAGVNMPVRVLELIGSYVGYLRNEEEGHHIVVPVDPSEHAKANTTVQSKWRLLSTARPRQTTEATDNGDPATQLLCEAESTIYGVLRNCVEFLYTTTPHAALSKFVFDPREHWAIVDFRQPAATSLERLLRYYLLVLAALRAVGERGDKQELRRFAQLPGMPREGPPVDQQGAVKDAEEGLMEVFTKGLVFVLSQVQLASLTNQLDDDEKARQYRKLHTLVNGSSDSAPGLAGSNDFDRTIRERLNSATQPTARNLAIGR